MIKESKDMIKKHANGMSGEKLIQKPARWKCQDFLSKTVSCERYQKLQKTRKQEKSAACLKDADLTPLKDFQVLSNFRE